MQRIVNSRRRLATASTVCGALLATVCVVPAGAFAWGGTAHAEFGDDIAQSFSPDILGTRCEGYPFADPDQRCPDYPFITRTPGPPPDLRPFAVIPEIDLIVWTKLDGEDPSDDDAADGEQVLREVLKWHTMKEDNYDLVTDWGSRGWAPGDVWPDNTVTHFWDADGSVMNSVKSEWEEVLWDTYPNAWEKAKILWTRAIIYWGLGDKGTAWMYVAHVLHLVQDQGLACHAKGDWHAIQDDSMEDWFDEETARSRLYSWSSRPGNDGVVDEPPPGGLMVPLGTDQVIADLVAAGGEWADDPDLLVPGPFGLQQLFYLMYAVNQYGDFSPTDHQDGDDGTNLPWTNFDDGIIDRFNAGGEPLTGPGSENTIEETDAGDHDPNGDLNLILKVGWRAAWRAAPMVVDLFRKVVDDVAPVSDVLVTRADGADPVEWNNSPLTVRLNAPPATTDGGRAVIGMPASGVWKVWGEVDQGVRPTSAADGSVFWLIATDGEHIVRPMSTDYMGNVEGQDRDFVVRVDLTPPEIAFPDLRPNYLTSEDFVPLWTAHDAASGVSEETAYLDGLLVPMGVPIDLSLAAGEHTLEVYAWDVAGNWRYETYAFEVWIDTATSALPLVVNSKSGGEGLMVYVEFPAPYDVGAIALGTCRLRPGGTIDLAAPFPVAGGSGDVPGELLGGVADRDKDGLPERLIRFDRELFLAAFGGVTGDVPAVVWGGLLPDGAPRFIGPVTVSVFTPPPK